MTILKRVYAVLLLLLICVTVLPQLPLDEGGWTIVAPSADSRIIYVSSSSGLDTNDGLSAETPVQSIARAVSLVRSGYPDHLLFKRGDEWFTVAGLGSFKSGRSATEPILVSYYGDEGPRPRFNIDVSFMSTFNAEASNLAFVGLEWYGYKHDPDSPDFSSDEKVDVFNMLGYGENILIEDCIANFASLGAFSPADISNKYVNLKLRRVIAHHSYAPDSYFVNELRTRTQGIYIHRTEGVLVEDCLFDHNGWNEKVAGSGPNMFNHNIYMSGYNPDPSKIIIRNNILARGSAHGIQLRSGGSATGNLFLQNAVNINVGFNYVEEDWTEMFNWVTDMDMTTVSDNVFLETRLMDSLDIDYPRTAARLGIGGIAIPCRIQRNIIANSLNKDGEAIAGYDDVNGIGGSVEKEDNIIYKFYKDRNKETPDPGWLDPDRSVGDYHQNLGRPGSVDSFLQRAYQRPVRTWWPEYSAESVIAYIAHGFSLDTDEIPPEIPPAVMTSHITDASVRISWLWATDNERTLGYNIYFGDDRANATLVKDTAFTIYRLSPETEYTVTVKAVDVSGNESGSRDAQFMTLDPDTNPPSKPGNPEMVGVTDHSLTFKWDRSVDDREIWGYKVYLDGTLYTDDIYQDTVISISDLQMGITYAVTVSSVDPAGNESEQSNELMIRVADSQPPSSPANVTILDIASTGFTISWDPATDNIGVTGYNVYLDNNLHGTTEQLSYTVTGATEGMTYRIGVSALDLDGNESRVSTPFNFTLGVSRSGKGGGVLVFPNPSEGNITIKAEEKILRIEIMDIIGSRIFSGESMSENELHIDVSQFAGGIYFIRVITADHQTVIRFTKE